ncbi:MAG: hypothetical protein PHQ65_09570 [Bacteroidales bacterium]|nr:hypothetical protein [Bacteroidales bacterium]MDD3665498.1 hypothetical protein [Bacteroidales bacterium]
MKNLLTTALVLFLALQSFAQLTYFNQTGKGFAIGGAYSQDSYSDGLFTSTTYGVTASARLSRGVSLNLQYIETSFKMNGYSQESSASALIPSITLQTSPEIPIGFAAHAGYTDSDLTGNTPTLLVAAEIFKRINSEGVLQVIPVASVSHSILLKDAYFDPKPVIGLGLHMAIRLGEKAFFVAGPSMSFSGGESNLTWEVGLVTQ